MIFKRKTKKEERPSPRQSRAKTGQPAERTRTRLGHIVLAVLSVYLIAAFYTPWTGMLGRDISSFILRSVGGASIIPILFVLYFSLSRLLSRKIPHLLRQSIGTFLVFMTASLLLGLNAMTSDDAGYPLWLSPGSFGTSVASGIYTMLGAFGTFIAGAFSIYISFLLYDIPLFTNIKLPGSSLFNFFNKKDDDKKRAEKGSLPDDAPNIAEYDGADYFGPAADETDIPPVTVTGVAPHETEDSLYSSEEIQDPEFNLDDGSFDGAEEGIFPPPLEIFGNEESREGEMDEEKSMPLEIGRAHV